MEKKGGFVPPHVRKGRAVPRFFSLSHVRVPGAPLSLLRSLFSLLTIYFRRASAASGCWLLFFSVFRPPSENCKLPSPPPKGPPISPLLPARLQQTTSLRKDGVLFIVGAKRRAGRCSIEQSQQQGRCETNAAQLVPGSPCQAQRPTAPAPTAEHSCAARCGPGEHVCGAVRLLGAGGRRP